MKRSLRRETLSKKRSNALLKRVQNWSHTNQLWSRNDKILVGISGGPDSVCLLHLLARIAQKSNLSLFSIHINYRLRGKESLKDELFVRSFCKDLSIPLFVYTPKIPKIKSENTLRVLRYQRFEKLRIRLGCASIAVGHNQNDQAETLLLHLFRGCGLTGMSGMSPKQNSIIRPLLSINRKEILNYLSSNSLSFREDASNTDTHYTRNCIRHKILPLIKRTIQPNIIERLSKSAMLFSDDAELLNSIPFSLYTKKGDLYSFNQKEFLSLPLSLQRRFLQNLFTQIRKSAKDMEMAHIEEIRKALLSQKNKYQKITFLGLIYEKKNDTVSIQKKTQ